MAKYQNQSNENLVYVHILPFLPNYINTTLRKSFKYDHNDIFKVLSRLNFWKESDIIHGQNS